MARRGHEVAVITTDRSDRLPISESSPGLEVIRVPAYPRDRDYYIAPALRRFVRYEQPDLVHVQSYHTAVAPLTLRWLAHTGTPHLLSFHSGGSSKRWRRTIRPVQYRILQHFTGNARMMVAVSEFERGLFLDRLGVPNGGIEVIRNGVSQDILDQAGSVERDPNLILTAGRLERYKGHHHVLAAMPGVIDAIPDAHLLVVGTGPYENELRAQAAALGIESAVRFTSIPQTDRGAMGRTLAGAAVTASFSDYEAEGIGAIESRAMGCRTVVTEDTALAELVDGDLVYGVAPGAPTGIVTDSLVRALKAGIPDHGVIPRTWADVTDDLEALYRRLLA